MNLRISQLCGEQSRQQTTLGKENIMDIDEEGGEGKGRMEGWREGGKK